MRKNGAKSLKLEVFRVKIEKKRVESEFLSFETPQKCEKNVKLKIFNFILELHKVSDT